MKKTTQKISPKRMIKSMALLTLLSPMVLAPLAPVPQVFASQQQTAAVLAIDPAAAASMILAFVQTINTSENYANLGAGTRNYFANLVVQNLQGQTSIPDLQQELQDISDFMSNFNLSVLHAKGIIQGLGGLTDAQKESFITQLQSITTDNEIQDIFVVFFIYFLLKIIKKQLIKIKIKIK